MSALPLSLEDTASSDQNAADLNLKMPLPDSHRSPQFWRRTDADQDRSILNHGLAKTQPALTAKLKPLLQLMTWTAQIHGSEKTLSQIISLLKPHERADLLPDLIKAQWLPAKTALIFAQFPDTQAFISNSPCLNEACLYHLIYNGTVEQALAISVRPDLSQTLIDSLIDVYGPRPAASMEDKSLLIFQNLLQNSAISLSSSHITSLAHLAITHNWLRSALVERPEFSPHLAGGLIGLLGPDLMARLKARFAHFELILDKWPDALPTAEIGSDRCDNGYLLFCLQKGQWSAFSQAFSLRFNVSPSALLARLTPQSYVALALCLHIMNIDRAALKSFASKLYRDEDGPVAPDEIKLRLAKPLFDMSPKSALRRLNAILQ